MNVVATADGRLVEMQGTGERRSFARAELDALIDLALAGIAELARRSASARRPPRAVEELRGKKRSSAPAKRERDVWS